MSPLALRCPRCATITRAVSPAMTARVRCHCGALLRAPINTGTPMSAAPPSKLVPPAPAAPEWPYTRRETVRGLLVLLLILCFLFSTGATGDANTYGLLSSP